MPIFYENIITRPSSKKYLILSDLVNELLNKGAVSEVPFRHDQFVSRIFSVKKKNGQDRLIIDLSRLNNFITKVPFSIESLPILKSLIHKNDFMVSIDLSDAFFSIPLHPDCKKFITFQLRDKRFSFNVLPFGLTSSPRIFSKLLRPAIIWLRSRGIKVSSYLDDIFLCHSENSVLSAHVSKTLDLLSSLGFNPNLSKSQLTPSREIRHLGFNWNSSNNSIKLPKEKILKTKTFAKSLLLSKTVSLRSASSFLGILNSLQPAFRIAPLYYRNLQFQFINTPALSWDDSLHLNSHSLKDVEWWTSMSNVDKFPGFIWPLKNDLTLFTDASSRGWGCYLSNGNSASGSWSPSEQLEHINFLELKAVLLSIQSFEDYLQSVNLHIKTDNSTAVHYLNKIGGTHSQKMCSLSKNIWLLCIRNNIQISSSHIAGSDNRIADFHSRNSDLNHEYCLSKSSFSDLLSLLNFLPAIDLFATKVNKKLDDYVSRFPDPHALQIDAFSFSWPKSVYLFPPIPLIRKAIEKFISDRVEMGLLITPLWPGLPQIPTICSMLISDPVILPASSLQGHRPTRHQFHLVAWQLSTISENQKAYQNQLQKRSLRAFPPKHSSLTRDTGKFFIHGLHQMGIRVRYLYP